MAPLRSLCTHPLLGLSLLVAVGRAETDVPLHQKIDKSITAALAGQPVAGPASDAEFLRRIHLDLVGVIPTVAETRAFLADADPDKRTRLIDRLLASPEHARFLANVLDVMLMERRQGRNGTAAPWAEALREAVAANKPWDVLAREILAGDGNEGKSRVLARFYLDRDAEPHLVTRDISRLFLGTNLQCAQCHDHPRVEEYRQEHYYGLFAFVSRMQLVREKGSNTSVLGEKADGEVTFQSVFDPAKTTKSTGPRIPNGPAIKEMPVEKGKEYLVAPGPGIRSVPRLSRLALLGPELTKPEHPAFRRNIANRLWAQMMGRGLFMPLDMDHPSNPPSHPELLELLAEDLAGHEFDMRYFLRELALSQTYQRSSELPSPIKEAEASRYHVANLKALSPEQLAWSLMQATGLTETTRKSLGAQASEAALFGRLAANVTPFVAAFGSGPGAVQAFDATVEQALFLANGATVRGWLTPASGNLTERLAAAQTREDLVEELYLSVFTRRPSAEECQEATRFLDGRTDDRPKVIQDLVWALLTSAEFRFNH